MTAAQLLSLLGGVAQVAALAWAWWALFRVWRERWPDEAVVPWAATAWGWVRERSSRVWYWMTLIPRRRTGEVQTVLAGFHASAQGTVTVAVSPDLALDQRVARVETLIRLVEDHHASEMRAIRQTIDERVEGLAEAQRVERAHAEHQEKRDARFNLTGPAVLAILGTALQTLAVFATGA